MNQINRERTRLITIKKQRKSYERQDEIPSCDQAAAESFYIAKQVNRKTPMVAVLLDGEEIRGFIQWQDRDCIKMCRFDGCSMVIRKSAIKKFYKQ